MLTIQHIQEDLSRAYIQAVAAKAGVNLSLGTQAHDYGVDHTFHQVEVIPRGADAEGKPYTRRLNSGFNLEFQCKASCLRCLLTSASQYDCELGLLSRKGTRVRLSARLLSLCSLEYGVSRSQDGDRVASQKIGVKDRRRRVSVVKQLPLEDRIAILGPVPDLSAVPATTAAEIQVLMKHLGKQTAQSSRRSQFRPDGDF